MRLLYGNICGKTGCSTTHEDSGKVNLEILEVKWSPTFNERIVLFVGFKTLGTFVWVLPGREGTYWNENFNGH